MITTILIILEQSTLYFPLVLGAYVSISLMKMPDLSIASAYTFGALLASKYMLSGNTNNTSFLNINLFITITLALLGGLIVGLVSSCLTQKAKFPHLLSSILTVGIFHGINQIVLEAGTQSLTHIPNCLAIMPLIKTNPELITLIGLSILLFCVAHLFFKTQLGYCLTVYGNNPQFFEHHNISGSFVFFSGILIANALAGLSGYLVAQTSSFVDTTMGANMALFCITALILGKTVARIKHPVSIIIPVAGTCNYFIIQQLLLKGAFNLKYFTMLQAFIVVIVLAITTIKKRARNGNQSTDSLGV